MELDVEKIIETAETLISMIEKYESIYLYGAGKVSLEIIHILKAIDNSDKIKKVFVSKVDVDSQMTYCDVCKFNVDIVNKDIPIIIAVSVKYRNEIKNILEHNNINNYLVLGEKFEESIKNCLLKIKIKNLRKEIDNAFLQRNTDKISNCQNDILFFSPPYWDTYAPFSAVPCLKAKLEQEGYQVGQVDLGIISIHNLLENNWRTQAEYFLSEQFYNDQIKEMEWNSFPDYESYKNVMWFFKENNRQIFPLNAVKKNYYNFNTVQKRVLESFYDSIYYLDTSAIDFDTCISIENALEEYTSVNFYEVLCRKEIKNILMALPNVIGISIVSTCQFIPGCILAKIIKENRPEIKIIFGGSCADLFVKSKYKNKTDIKKFFDYILIGEGETAITMLLKHIKTGMDIGNVPNLVLIDENGDIFYNELIIENVHSLPVPDYTGLDLDLYLAPYPVLPYQTSRGCHYGYCAFCNHDKSYRHNYRSKDMKKVVQELLYLSRKYNVKHFQFVDEAIKPDCFEIMVNEMEMHKEFKNIKWFCYSRVSRLYNKEILDRAKKNGCDMVMFGIETLNQRLLSFIKKGITSDTSEYCLKLFHECGIKTYAWLMCNLPSETLDEVESDYKRIKSLKQCISAISVGLFMLERNTEMYQNPDEYNILKIDNVDIRQFISHNNGNVIDKKEMFRFYYEKYLPLQTSWNFSANRYTLFFEETM